VTRLAGVADRLVHPHGTTAASVGDPRQPNDCDEQGPTPPTPTISPRSTIHQLDHTGERTTSPASSHRRRVLGCSLTAFEFLCDENRGEQDPAGCDEHCGPKRNPEQRRHLRELRM